MSAEDVVGVIATIIICGGSIWLIVSIALDDKNNPSEPPL